MLLSIVVLSYNRPAQIERILKNFIGFNDNRVQLIIKDDRYIITDDIGGSVVLEKSNIDELINQYQEYIDLKSLKEWSLGK